MTLLEWNNEQPINYLWICGVGCPAGRDFHHDTQADGDDYCDFTELGILDDLWSLNGDVDKYGRWCWDGKGDPRDERGNSILNVEARR